MLAPKAQYNLGDAKKYFKEHLAVGDYYAEGQTVPGQWIGQGAADLGLTGVTTADEFVRLCENLHPQTGERLTLRQKTTRTEMSADGRNVRRPIAGCFTISHFHRPNPFPSPRWWVTMSGLSRHTSRR